VGKDVAEQRMSRMDAFGQWILNVQAIEAQSKWDILQIDC